MKQNSIKIDSQFLIRVLQNKVDENEKKYFEEWLAKSDQNKEEFGTIALLWEEMDKVEVSEIPDSKAQWDIIAQKIKAHYAKTDSEFSADSRETYVTQKTQQITKKGKSFYDQNSIWFIRVAAILVLGVGFIYLYNHLESNKPYKPLSERQAVHKTTNLKYEKATAKGERMTFPLSDGSIVYLNSDSKLIYPKYFNDNERKLELVGEAYFSVKRDLNKPFKVICGNMTVVVTGTEFNIKNRDNKIKVVVAKGSVLTFSDKSPEGVSLQKGEMVSLEKNGHISRPIKVDLTDCLAWRQNKLSFSHTSLPEVMKEIERYYNIDVVFRNDLHKDRTITGIFKPDNTSLDDVLNILSLTLDIKITRENNKIFVY